MATEKNPTPTSTSIQNDLEQLAQKYKCKSIYSKEFVQKLDQNDPLKKFRDYFYIPKQPPYHHDSPESIYLCGNSLGAMPKKAEEYVKEELTKWKDMGVEGHFLGKRPWVSIDEKVTQLAAKIVGASPNEVAIMNGLSVNLHLMFTSFYRPTPKRYKILMEDFAFCSDQHVVYSQVKYNKFDPDKSIIALKPRASEYTLRTEDILDIIEKEGDSIALIMFGGVQFYTGQLFEMEKITKAGHKRGCIVAFDLAHAVGNVPLQLHKWGVDWAAWCTYKYLNSGAGAIAGIFVHERHHSKSFEELPRYLGWWGQTPEDRFKMSGEHKWKPGAQSYMLSNPPILPCLCLEASLEAQVEADPFQLRQKSYKLTRFLELSLSHYIDAKAYSIMTPTDPTQRGCQLSLLLTNPVRPVHKKLIEQGVVCDVREPNCLRVAPNPLYNNFMDVYRFVNILKDCLGPQSKL